VSVFYLDRLNKLDGLLRLSTDVYRSYADSSLDLPRDLGALLNEAGAVYEGFGSATVCNELAELRAQFVCAQRGIDPATSEKVIGHRRDLERGVALRVLSQSSGRIRKDVARYVETVEQARAQLRPAVLLAIQKKLVDVSGRVPMTQEVLAKLWSEMIGDPDLSLAARQVATIVSVADATLLLAELVDAATSS
jgi:hypothetical protein